MARATVTKSAWLSLGWLLLALGCTTQPRLDDDGSVCAEARRILNGCGVTLTLVAVRDCAGPSEAAASCVVDNASTCEELADIRFDQCLEDALQPVVDTPPYEPVPTDPSGGLPDAPPDPSGTNDDENTDSLCADGLDNDSDGFVDCDDVGCSQAIEVTVCGAANGQHSDQRGAR